MTVPLPGFLYTYPGLFVTQAFFHSLVASFVCEIALKAWAVKDPAVRQKVFLVPIVAPVVLFPLFRQAMGESSGWSPSPGSAPRWI